MKGFTLYVKGKDYFFETSYVNKTKTLAKKVIRALNGNGLDIPDNAEGIDAVLYNLQKANCEIRSIPNGSQYYEIYGDNFAGKGSFTDDGMTVIIKL